DAIGAKGANYLTWSCLHDLSEKYGALFTPTPELDERKESGQNWYPLDHARPLVNWAMNDNDEDNFQSWIFGPMIQMTSLMLKEQRAHLAHINAIGELCAQFRRGILAVIRNLGPDASIKRVESYHRLHPEAAGCGWYPDMFSQIEGQEWQQLYVNAEHDGDVGVITIGRESYNNDVDAELNRAIDWLKSEGIKRVIVTGDFHLSTQMIGADTSDFFPGLSEMEAGLEVSRSWSRTARRLHDEFQLSVGFVNGKRCLGGFLELLMHCHYLVSTEGADLGMPEVTLPVVPGMEGCHWPFRKTGAEHWPKLLEMLLEGKPFKARDTVGWLIDYAGSMDEALKMVWKVVTDGDHGLPVRKVKEGALKGLPKEFGHMADLEDPNLEAGRRAIFKNIQDSCGSTLSEALDKQARHSADFMTSSHCRKGIIGAEFKKTMVV
ncbi:MAG: enoyl-CoA hydratase/isomerase family protein, partial [Candidatus Krumholzibacteria bacterium]|nr:enoyl-CoA hydratase/isomerase family protein [Candidatus Krumholzibacteria bacterium]